MNTLMRVMRALTAGLSIFLISLSVADLTTAYITDSSPGETTKYVMQKTGEYLENRFTLGVTKIAVQNSIPPVLPQAGEEKKVTPIPTATQPTPDVIRIKPENPVGAPAPKKKLSPTETAELTPAGIFIYTNDERARDGKTSLTWNDTLAKIAEHKAHDMQNRQYFAHESPDGKGPQDLAKDYGYDYLLVGENLALGDFYSDRDVMDGWMHSPGHRANILKPGYTEIGTAAFLGTYNNRPAWFAVQEFGRPNAKCPKPSDTEKAWIESEHDRVRALVVKLDAQRAAIDTYTGDSATKSQMVNDFNALVQTHNQLLEALKQRIAAFNSSVTVYNVCIEHARTDAGISATDTPQIPE